MNRAPGTFFFLKLLEMRSVFWLHLIADSFRAHAHLMALTFAFTPLNVAALIGF